MASEGDAGPEVRGGNWQHGLFGCFDNFTLCIITALVPCYTFGKNAEALGESCILYGLLFMVPCLDLICGIMFRGKIRERKGIDGSFIGDIVMWWCCGYCALCQEAQELDVMSGGGSSGAMASESTVMERQ